ncbi:MAG: efflux RND transporter periplasmic adaptor subunit [Vicinamibacterales bacterium]
MRGIVVKATALMMIGAGVVTLAACQAPAETAAEKAAPAVAASLGRVETVDWPSTYEAGGVVRARQVAVLSSRVVAPVVEVRVKAGDRVTRGQVLIQLDAREVAAQATRASAAAAGTRLSLEAAHAERRAAESSVVLARATHDRVKGLRDKNSATAQELDQVVAGLAAAEARLAGATARVAEAEAGLAAARAGEEAASVGASYAVLTAPFSGLVSNRQVDPGSMAAPGVPLLTIEDTSGYRLEVRVDESRARLVAPGAAAEVRIDRGEAEDEGWTAATVAEVESVDPSLHSFVVKLDLPRMADIRSGVFGRARVLGPPERVLAVPAAAVVRRGQLTFAFVVDGDGAARLRMLSPGRDGQGRIEVLAGLQDGDRVVLSPPDSVEDGTPIAGAAGGRQ